MKLFNKIKYKINILHLTKQTGIFCVFTGISYCVHQIYETYYRLNHVLNTEVLELEKKRVEYIYIADPNIQNIIESIQTSANYKYDIFKLLSFQRISETLKKSLAWRYLVLAESTDRDFRLRAVRSLSQLTSLKDCDYWQIAQLCDSRTAIGLARSPNVDLRLFLRSPLQATKEIIIQDLDNFFERLNTKSHYCLENFILKVFNKYKKRNIFHDSSDLEYNISYNFENELIPLTLEALLHHATIDKNALDYIGNDGLAILMKIALLYKDDKNISINISKILSYMSISDSVIEPLFNTGWVGKLAAWAQSTDVRLAVPAQRTLANIDVDYREAKFPRRVYLLHPANRNYTESKLDIIFIHGLLGGVFVTWRQRDREDKSGFSLIGSTQTKEESPKKIWSSDENTQEFLEQLHEYHQGKWKELGKDFEIVMPDCPVATEGPANGPFYIPRNDIPCLGYTRCWPRDWLPYDCSNIRILGINYETNLSTWGKVCPLEGRQSLEQRSSELLSKLKEVGIGKKPIIWVAHSMGGLLVKGMLTQAAASADPQEQALASNTKALFFYSVPHRGSPVAALGSPSQMLISPSVEVQELREGSPALIELHKNFLEFIDKYSNIEIISFGETRNTVISTLRMEFNLVPLNSANPGVGEFYEIPQDHLCICKPANRHSFIYQKLVHLINKHLK